MFFFIINTDGTAELEIKEGALGKDSVVLIIDDLLATGGTFLAASALIEKVGAKVGALGK